MPPVRRNYEGAVKMASQTPQSNGFGHLCALGDLAEVLARIRGQHRHVSLDIGTVV